MKLTQRNLIFGKDGKGNVTQKLVCKEPSQECMFCGKILIKGVYCLEDEIFLCRDCELSKKARWCSSREVEHIHYNVRVDQDET